MSMYIHIYYIYTITLYKYDPIISLKNTSNSQ